MNQHSEDNFLGCFEHPLTAYLEADQVMSKMWMMALCIMIFF